MILGSKISLQPFDRSHLEKTRQWANDPELTQLMDRSFPISDFEHEQWYSGLSKRKDEVIYFAIVANESGKHIGNIWLWNISWVHRKAEISVVVGEKSNLGNGVGSEAIDLITEYAFRRINLHKVYAHVLAINPRAIRAFEKAGLAIEGVQKKDRWVDDTYVDVYILARFVDANLTKP